MADLNAEYHETALLENQKRFYKRSGWVRSVRKHLDESKETCFACGKLDDEGSTKIRVFMAIPEDEPSVGKVDEPFPPLPKLIAPFRTSKSLISLFDLTLNMANLTLDTHVPKKTKPSVKVSHAYVIKKKIEKSPDVPKPCYDKKADSPTEKLFLTLMEEVKGLKRKIEIPSGIPSSSSQPSNSKATKKKTCFRPCPKVVFRDDSSGDTEGYASVNCNGITFTR
uniref:Uncharacterized protein n=1 Tax=Tanacetum cinerariifolium TaxID=118510 RepID=A0A6L2JSD2_TANCI|nr:hypothetical protein [Tanacetum cinerariifolium]